jgi:hypothetical protein
MTLPDMVRHLLFRNGAPITHRAHLGKGAPVGLSGSFSMAFRAKN